MTKLAQRAELVKTRRGRPRWKQTLHRLAPPLCPKKNIQKKYVTCDLWHLTPDTWHLTPDTWHLGMKVSWRFWTKGSVPQLMNEWMNYKGVYRTAPATTGLLIILNKTLVLCDIYISHISHKHTKQFSSKFLLVQNQKSLQNGIF